MALGDPKPVPAATGDALTDTINNAAYNSLFYPPYRDQVLAMRRGYAPILGLNAQSDWGSIFKKTMDYQFGKYNNWSTYDNPSQTFFKVIEQNEMPNREKVKSYIQGTSQYQQEAQAFTSAWNESNKSTGSFFNDVLTVAAIAVAIAFPELSGFIGQAMGAGAAASASAIAAGNAVISGGMAAIQGKSFNDILEAAAIGGVGSAAGGAASGAAGGGVAGAAASGATSAGIGALARGEDVSKAVITGGATAAITAGVKGATATPGQAETTGAAAPTVPADVYAPTGEMPPTIPEGAPPTEQPLPPEEAVKQFPDLYPGRKVPEPGQETTYFPTGEAITAEKPVYGQVEPQDLPAYDESGTALTPDQVAAKYPDLYPGGKLPQEGEVTKYSPGEPGINIPGGLLSQIFNLGMKTPGGGGGGPGYAYGSTAGMFGGSTSPSKAMGEGDIESSKTGGKRRNVWNVASLRNLQEGLGV